jgi:hypothetical protein
MATPPVFVSGQILTAAQMNQLGMFLVKSETLATGQTSIAVANAFTSDYSRYLIQIEDITRSAEGNILFQLTGITGNVYTSSGFFTTYGSAVVTGYGPAAAANLVVASLGTGAGFIQITITNPNSAAAKDMISNATGGTTNYNFVHRVSSSSTATGFTLSVTGGGITFGGGVVKVYGFRD